MNSNLFFVILSVVFLAACGKNEAKINADLSVTDADLKKIEALGFNKDDVIKFEDGFIVEGDIFLSRNHILQHGASAIKNLLPDSEHYRSPGLVSVPSGVIRVYVFPSIPPALNIAVDSALFRYNSLGLAISFVKVATPAAAHIHILPVSLGGSKTGVSGFPAGGNPFMPIRLNVPLLSSWIQPTVITAVTHLIGHAIGFLHTDLSVPSYSCSIPITDSVPASPGFHIPGTPTGPSAGSWMLTCISNGINRPFTTADITALNILY